ncbi:ABC transporter [Pseudomonas sp. TCU-HL1]|nr:ABC transporter [Pseudomonas sp. TCU-HL1]
MNASRMPMSAWNLMGEAFKKVVDKAIADTFASGEINGIYDKWFIQPIPPKGLNLNFPMSNELKQLVAQPTDKAPEEL